jgi:hypothetical protein
MKYLACAVYAASIAILFYSSKTEIQAIQNATLSLICYFGLMHLCKDDA